MATSWITVPVRGTFLGTAGVPLQGYVEFVPNAPRVIDLNDVTTSLATSYRAVLDARGKISIRLPANDDPNIQPQDWNYQVTEHFTGGQTYAIDVLAAMSAPGIDLTHAAPVPPNAGIPPANITRLEFLALQDQVNGLGTGGGGVGGVAVPDTTQFNAGDTLVLVVDFSAPQGVRWVIANPASGVQSVYPDVNVYPDTQLFPAGIYTPGIDPSLYPGPLVFPDTTFYPGA